jgi:hypothetical protein
MTHDHANELLFMQYSCLFNYIFIRSRPCYRPIVRVNYAIQSDFSFCPKTFAYMHIRSFSCYGAG